MTNGTAGTPVMGTIYVLNNGSQEVMGGISLTTVNGSNVNVAQDSTCLQSVESNAT